jgi:hypothetical protein
MILRRDPRKIEAQLVEMTDDDRAAFLEARSRFPTYDIDPEDGERMARGELRPGDPITLYLDGKPIAATFGGVANCC